MTPSAVLEQDRALRELTDTDWQHKHALEDGASETVPTGLLEYEARCAVRNITRLYGHDTARELFAGYLNDEADRRAS